MNIGAIVEENSRLKEEIIRLNELQWIQIRQHQEMIENLREELNMCTAVSQAQLLYIENCEKKLNKIKTASTPKDLSRAINKLNLN
tara:strand:+ start:390 stop:647 length:258 start_codon:yes stop_codon:yes gene_type:complete